MVKPPTWSFGTIANDTLGVMRPVDLSLGGVTVVPSSAPASAGLPVFVAANQEQGVRIEFAHGRNWDAYGSLFQSPNALNSAYLDGASTYASARFGIAPDVTLEFNHNRIDLDAYDATPPGGPTSELAQRLGAGVQLIGTTSANLNWNFADWGGISLSAARARGEGSLLGTVGTSAGPASLAESTTLGISARVGFGEGWVTTVAYAEGVTQLDLSGSQLNARLEPVRSQAYAIGVSKQGLFGDDALGIALSRPLQVYRGANLQALNPSLNQVRESDVSLGYVTTFMDGSLALQANAAYQLNAAGVSGQNAVTGVARAKLNF